MLIYFYLRKEQETRFQEKNLFLVFFLNKNEEIYKKDAFFSRVMTKLVFQNPM